MKSIKVFLLLFLSVCFFTTCDNPIGLGTKVNTEKPVISNGEEGSKPGDFLQGSDNKIWLNVEQEFGIAEVFMEVDYTGLDGNPAYKKIPAIYDEERQQWYVDIDTSYMMDGKITAKVTAIDVDGNKTTTTEMIYRVKNLLPQIKLNIPLVDDNNWDDNVFLDNLINTDPLYLGFELLGLATDDYGIAEDYPKIMIWPADDKSIPVDGDGIPLSTNGQYGTWRSMVVPRPGPGLTATKISWPMQRLVRDLTAPGGYRLPKDNESRTYLSQGEYRIRIVTKDLFGNENYYPDRRDTTRDPNNPSKKYFEINYIASDIPISQVTKYPQYYNAASEFTVNFIVSCTNELLAVNPVEAYITDGNDGTEEIIGGPYYPVQGSTAKSPYPFTLTITAAEAKLWDNPKEGTLFVRLIAKDKNAKDGPPIYQHFMYDVTPPSVPIDRPVSLSNVLARGNLNGGRYEIYYPSMDTPKWVTGTVTVGGINTDDNGIKEVWYHVGKLGDDFSSNEYWNTHYNDSSVWNDTRLDTIIDPADGWGGSVYAWTYTVTYPIGYKGGNKSLIQEYGDLNGYTTLNNSDTSNKERFYLPLYVKVVDNAGNFTIVHYKLCVDPLLDEPQITIAYPQEGSIVGGTLRLSGSATDNYWMHTVLIRVTKVGESGYYIPTTTPTTQLFYTNPDYASYPKPKVGGVETTEGWFKANKNGDDVTVSWSYSLNQDKGLNHLNSNELQDVIIEVVAIDTDEISHQTPHITGPVATLNVQFSSNVPIVEDAKIVKDNVDDVTLIPTGTKTSGKFKISMVISAMDGFNSVKTRINGTPSSDKNLILNDFIQPLSPGYNIEYLNADGNRKFYHLTIDIDSTTAEVIQPAIYYGNTGNMTLELMLEDNTENHYSGGGTYIIGIDNFYPTAKIETSKIATGNFLVEGTAQDWGSGSGNIQGLERVLVYLEKAIITYTDELRNIEGTGNYLKANSGGTAPSTDFVSYPNVIDTTIGNYSGKAPNVSLFPNFPRLETANNGVLWTSPVAMVIDYAENDPEADYDSDDTYGEMWNGLLDKAWGARMKTSNFSDGPYIVHYIVMDQAGNATHYQKDIFIENNKPKITSINIGTDINFDNAITGWTSQSAPGEFRQDAYIVDLSSEGRGYITVSKDLFKIRNNMFGLRLGLASGNINKTVIVSYTQKSGSTIQATAMVRGRVYEIAINAQNTDFTKYGAPNNYVGTVFVASSEGDGDGQVYQYTAAGFDSTQYFDYLGPDTVTVPISFNKFIGVPDGESVKFVVKVFDSALSSEHGNPREQDYLANVVLLTVAVSNTDTEDPSITVANFGEKVVTKTLGDPRNDADKDMQNLNASEYNVNVAVDASGKKLGYVQYGRDNSPADDIANISGRVIFTGKAADNHRIQRITAQIPGFNGGSEFNIAVYNNNGLTPAAISTDWEFKVDQSSEIPQLSLEYGHALNWQFIWDSSKHTSVAANNVTIIFRAYDHASPNRITTSSKTVNIVPYISEVETQLSKAYASKPSAFNRSTLGGYPVRESETITIKGFNLGTFNANSTTNNVTIGGGTNYLTLSATNRSLTEIQGTVPNTVASGALEVKVNNIPSINNTSNKNAAYNQEPNNLNNNILTNERSLYIWSVGSIYTRGEMEYPFMRVNSSGRRLITYGTYATNGRLRLLNNHAAIDAAVATGAASVHLDVDNTTNRYLNLTVAADANNWFIASSNMTANQANWAMLHARAVTGTTGANNTGTNKSRIISLGDAANQTPNRVRIPRIHSREYSANNAMVVMSYGDDTTANYNINFHYGTVTGTTPAAFGGNFTAASTAAASTIQAVTSATSTIHGSMYTAVATLSDGRPVIAWYDKDTQKIYVSYGNTPANNSSISTTATDDWQGRATEVHDGAGAHVDMAVDGGDNVHLAYNDVSNGGLHYAYIPKTGIPNFTTGGATNRTKITGIEKARVDTYLSAGTKLMINVRNEGTDSSPKYVPYITYLHASFYDTKNAVRVAWPVTSHNSSGKVSVEHGTNSDDTFTGKWEVMTVPAINVPLTNYFVCNGVPTTTGNWVPLTGTNALSGYWTTSNTQANSLIHKTILIGYMTDTRYEGAVLKKSLW